MDISPTTTILMTIVMCLIQRTRSLGYTGYSPYYGGLGGYGGYGSYGGYGGLGCGYGSLGCGSLGYKTCSPYPYTYGHSYGASCLSPCCLKAKLLKSCLALKKPCLLPKPCLPCLPKPCLPCLHKPCLPCLSRLHQPSACIKTDACIKYPPCGPCPYASFQPKCLKHKATLALCSA